ncbi:MAG: hypothetical protein KDK97_16465, partial [Verrucomicrobiales bacterium]|nr:hypothetical protein [Verrucomicrobiales bacterium]
VHLGRPATSHGSILSNKFLAELRRIKRKNVAAELGGDCYQASLQEEAVKTGLQQAELLCADWV